MKLYIEEKVFTWGDKFTVVSATGEPRYFVEGEVFTWGKKLHVYDVYEREVAFIKQELFTFLPEFVVYTGGREIARVRKEFSFFRPRYAERKPATSREGPMVSFDHQPSRPNRLPALPG